MKFDVFGRIVEVTPSENGWQVYYPSDDGKKRRARDINIPPDLTESELADFLADLLHEYATIDKNTVTRLD